MMAKLFIYTIKQLLRDKEALFWIMIFPVIFILIFSLFDFSGGVNARILVVNKSNNEITNNLLIALGQIEGVGVNTSVDSLDEAKEALSKSKEYEFNYEEEVNVERPNVVLFIPEGYGEETYTTEVYYNESEEGQISPSGIITSIVSDITDEMVLQNAGVENPFNIERKGVSVNEIGYFDILVPGIIGMSIMQSGIIGMATVIATLKEKRVLKRLSATPLPIWKFLLVEVLTRVVITIIQITIMLSLSVAVLGASIYGNIPLLYFIGIFSSFVFLTLGFVAAAITNSANAASGLASVLTTPMMFLSGVFFDRETLPNVIKVIADFLPLSPVLDAMREVSLQEAGFREIQTELVIIAMWTIVSFILAAKTFNFREES